MGYILLDTCTWINLASTPLLQPLVQELERHAAGPPHKVLIPESVRIEFDRHRSGITSRWEKSLRGHLNSVKMLRPLIPEHNPTISQILEASQHALAAGGATVASAEKAVVRLLDSAEARHHSAADFEMSSRRCLQHHAPATSPKRSSIGDCLLWLTVLNLLDEACVWFCTENIHDFSKPDHQDELREELRKEVDGKKHKLHYFFDPSKLIEHLNQLEQRVPSTPLPNYADYFPNLSAGCPNCGGLLADGGWSPSTYGGWTWKKICTKCGERLDTGEFMDD